MKRISKILSCILPVFMLLISDAVAYAKTTGLNDVTVLGADSESVIPFLIAIGVSLILTFVLTLHKLSQMNTAKKNTYANDYIKPGSMNMKYSRDIFLYSHVDRREKPKSNNSTRK